MGILSDPTPDMLAMPRFDDGAIDMQELLRRLAERVVNAVMDAEADQLCGGGANSRNGYRERSFATCVGTQTLRIPKLRSGSFFPEDVLERHRRVDRALVVDEMYATGTSTRKVQRVAEKMGVSRLSKDQVSAIASSLDADVEELCARPLDSPPVPYVWLDATYVKCRREGRVASTAVVTAIGCDAGGWRRVLGVDVVDTESYDSWLAFLRAIRSRGAAGVGLVVSDAHPGLVRALGEVFRGLATPMRTVPGGARETGGPYMRDPRHPRHSTDEFKRQIVGLHNAGKSKREAMDEYDLGKSTVERWIKSINATGSPRAADSRTPGQDRILELERENRRLRMEVDLLKQAAPIYARK